MNNIAKYTLALLVLNISIIFSENISVNNVDIEFAQQRRTLNHRYAGLAGAGVSIPEPVSSISMNPALVHHFHQYSEKKHTISIGYERDSLFDAMILNGGTSFFINERTTISGIYRFLKNSRDKNKYAHEATISVSGTMFDQGADAQGGVDIGLNMRYSYSKWHERRSTSLQTSVTTFNISDTISNSIIANDTMILGKQEEHRLLFDVGLFQDNIIDNLDLGVTFYNLFGFHWKKNQPIKKDSIYSDTSVGGDTITETVVENYNSSWKKDNGKNHKSYKRMTVGFSYHVPLMNEKLNILVPFDLEFLRLFNKDEKIKLAFHTGLETWLLKGIIGLRFGYARAPYNISGTPGHFKIENENIFTGGGSLRVKMFGLDLYFTEYRQEWGLNAFVSF